MGQQLSNKGIGVANIEPTFFSLFLSVVGEKGGLLSLSP